MAVGRWESLGGPWGGHCSHGLGQQRALRGAALQAAALRDVGSDGWSPFLCWSTPVLFAQYSKSELITIFISVRISHVRINLS